MKQRLARLFLVFVLAAMLAARAAASTGIDAVRPPPDPDNAVAWDRWFHDAYVAHLRSQLPTPAAGTFVPAGYTAYYFSSSGSNANNGLTTSTPKQTVAAADAIVDAAGATANVAILFKRGDVFDSTTGITTSGKSNVYVGSWHDAGSRAKGRPLLNAYTVKFASSGWSDSGNGIRFTRAYNTTTIGDLRIQAQRERVLQRVTSTALVDSTPDSFYHESATTLHINVSNGSSSNPSTTGYSFEASAYNTNHGFDARNGDRVRVSGLRFDGFGIRADTQHYYGTYFDAALGQLMGIDDCEVTRGGYHLIGTHGEGIHLVYGNRVDGVITEETANLLNAYVNVVTGTTQGEHVYVNNTVGRGRLPHSGWYNAVTAPRSGNAWFAHPDTGGEYFKVLAFVGTTIENVPYGVRGAGSAGNTPVSDHRDSRFWEIGTKMLGYQYGGVGSMAPGIGGYKRDCVYELKITEADNNFALSDGLSDRGGWVTNCVYRVNVELFKGFTEPSFLGNFSYNAIEFAHCHFEMFNTPGVGAVGMGYRFADSSVRYPNVTLYNSVVAFRGSHAASQINLPAANIHGNLYCNVLRETGSNPNGWDSDADAVVDANIPRHDVPPASAAAHVGEAVALPNGRKLKYDLGGRLRRGNATIGPWEPADRTLGGVGGGGRAGMGLN